jgi:hypothetical protein
MLLATTSSFDHTEYRKVDYLAKTSMVPVNIFGEGQGPLKTLGNHLLPAVVGIVTAAPARHVVSFSLPMLSISREHYSKPSQLRSKHSVCVDRC